jgi:preprotein translocase subunit SecG
MESPSLGGKSGRTKDVNSVKKSWTKIMAIAAILVMVATVGMGMMASAQPSSNTELTLPFISNPVTPELNVTLSQISYISQPTEWQFSGSHADKAFYTNSTAWVVKNSGDLFIVNNSTTLTAPTDSAVNFPVATSLGSPINYMFGDSRLSFNGTGETAYYLISEGNQTTPPSSSGNVLKASAGAAQNVIAVIITVNNATTSTVSVGYFADSDSGAYQNYTTYSFSSLYLNALQWYDFMVYVQPTGTVVSIMNSTGSIIASSTTLTPVIDGNISKITTVSYISSEAASTKGDMLILGYSYLVDRNVYQSGAPSAPMAGAIGESMSSVAPFDPGANQDSNYTQAANSTGSYLDTNVSMGSFTAITNSSTTAAENSGLINVSLETQANDTLALSPSALTDIRTASYIPSTFTTNLYVSSWTSAGINASIVQYLQSEIGALTGIDPSEINVVNYIVVSMSLDIQIANSTMSELGNYLDNAIPGILSAQGLALEDSLTGAIQAGSMAGYFMTPNGPIAPIIKGNLIENPFTGYVYNSPMEAGFPVGSYVELGAIIVPQWTFLGFAADGQPMFTDIPLAWNPFSGLTGAASAISNFFHSAASTITNAIKPVTNSLSTTASKIVDTVSSAPSALSTALHTAVLNIQRTASNVMPTLAGSVGTLSKDITGTVSHAVTGTGAALADIKSSVTGAVLAGVNNVKQGISNIGTAITKTAQTTSGKIAATFDNGISAIFPPVTKVVNSAGQALSRVGNAIYTTLGTVGTTINNVVSPIVNTVRNLPTAIVNGTQTLVKGAQSLGQSIASDAANLGITIKNGTMNALDTIGNTITGAGKEIQNAFGNITASMAGALKAPFSFFMGLSGNVAHIIEYAALGGAVVVLVIIGLVLYNRHEGHRRGGRHKKK